MDNTRHTGIRGVNKKELYLPDRENFPYLFTQILQLNSHGDDQKWR